MSFKREILKSFALCMAVLVLSSVACKRHRGGGGSSGGGSSYSGDDGGSSSSDDSGNGWGWNDDYNSGGSSDSGSSGGYDGGYDSGGSSGSDDSWSSGDDGGWDGGRIGFSGDSSASHDLEKKQAEIEQKQIAKISEKLTAQYGFSEERAVQVARIGGMYTSLVKSRQITVREQDQLSQSLLGIDLKNLESSVDTMVKGDSRDYDSLIEKSAEYNQVTPEAMRSLVQSFIEQ